MTTVSLPARLLRGFAVDFLTAHNPAAAEWIMDPAYCLSIGGHVLNGRDTAYLPATLAQLDQFPGLCVTCHDVVLSPDAVAMRFTEHGVSAREGLPSSWGGITLFRIDGGRLRQGWAEEDYLARKRQLKTGICDAILPPHRAPWDSPMLPADADSARLLRNLLADPAALLERAEDMSMEGPRLLDLLAPSSIEISMLFTAGTRAAFHAVIAGSYRGGFAEIPRIGSGQPGTLPVAGIVDIAGNAVVRVQLCGDRLGLSRQWLTRRYLLEPLPYQQLEGMMPS